MKSKLFAILLMICTLPAYAQNVKCSEWAQPNAESYDNHRICRYYQATLQSAYQTWRTDWLNKQPKASEAKMLLHTLPVRNRTVKNSDTQSGLIDIEYKVLPNKIKIIMNYEGGVSTYQFSQKRGYVELHEIDSPD